MSDNDNVIPPPNSGRPPKYGFDRLRLYGDSMYIETDNIPSARDSAYKFASRNGFKVATRLVDGGIRVYHAGAIEGALRR